MTRQEELEFRFDDENLKFSQPFLDDAIIGVDFHSFNKPSRVVYDIDKSILLLVKEYEKNDGKWCEAFENEIFSEAAADLSCNYIGMYLGENDPIWLDTDLFD